MAREGRNAGALAGLLCSLLMLVWGAVVSAAPLAGTQIDNQVSASYVDGTGTPTVQTSNLVRTIVLPLESVDVEADLSVARPSGANVDLPHSVRNTGNVFTSFAMDSANLGGDDFDLIGLTVYRDVNGNGAVDLGEPVILPGGTVDLNPNEVANLVLFGTLPGALPAQVGRVELRATGSTPAVTDASTDTITVVDGAFIDLNKSASDTTPTPGQTVEFTLAASSIGAVSAGSLRSSAASSRARPTSGSPPRR